MSQLILIEPSKFYLVLLGHFVPTLSQLDSDWMVRTMTVAPVTAGVGDVGELYGTLARRLEQLVRLDVRAPDAVIEDACQFAWSRLVIHSGRVSAEGALSWLATTAVREALKLLRKNSRELSLDAGLGASSTSTGASSLAPLSPIPGPHEALEYRERLLALRCLPQRQRQMLWLQGAGLSYAEIATATGCTTRTVERQLLRAKRALREQQ
jgi:RNA polymerase sigma factor (sigma-70 family)